MEQQLAELRADVQALGAAAAKLEKGQATAALEAQRAALTQLQRGQVRGTEGLGTERN